MSARKRARSGDTRAPPAGAVAPTARPGAIAIAALARGAPTAPDAITAAAPDAITTARWATMIEQAAVLERKRKEAIVAATAAADALRARQSQYDNDTGLNPDGFFLSMARRVAADPIRSADPAQLKSLEAYIKGTRRAISALESMAASARTEREVCAETISKHTRLIAQMRALVDSPDGDLVKLDALRSRVAQLVTPAQRLSNVSVQECRVQ